MIAWMAWAAASEGTLLHDGLPGPLPVLLVESVPSTGLMEWTFTVDAPEAIGSASFLMGTVDPDIVTYTVTEPDPASPGSTRVVRTLELSGTVVSAFAFEALVGSAAVVRIGITATASRECVTSWPSGTATCSSWHHVFSTPTFP